MIVEERKISAEITPELCTFSFSLWIELCLVWIDGRREKAAVSFPAPNIGPDKINRQLIKHGLCAARRLWNGTKECKGQKYVFSGF
jgi:hypothetical protein